MAYGIKDAWLDNTESLLSRVPRSAAYTVGRINFEDKKFREFRGYLLNLEIKYPRNFLHNRSGRFLFNMYTWWVNGYSFMEVLQTSPAPKSKLLYHRLY